VWSVGRRFWAAVSAEGVNEAARARRGMLYFIEFIF
jgi:hypothetical protein